MLLRAANGQPASALSWIPAKPGTLLREKIQVPLLIGILLLALLAQKVIRIGRSISPWGYVIPQKG